MGPAVAVEVHAGRGRKSEMTRQRLLDSANRLFRADGYAATTAAAIAGEAGVTERTFYRYFLGKADVLLTTWQRRRDALHRALVTSDAPEVVEVVCAAMHEFAEHVRIGIDAGVDSMLHVFTDQDAASAVLQVLLAIEQDLAIEIARRVGRSSEDLAVRTAAYATVGVFRASLRAVVEHGDPASITTFVDEGMDRVRPLYADLDPTSPPG